MITAQNRRLDKAALFKLLGYQPHEGQWAVHRSKASRRVLACGVRWGKTRAAAMEGLAAAMEPRAHSMGWVVAPTYDLGDKVFRELVVISAEHLRHRIVALKEHEKRLILCNLNGGTSEIRCKSADSPVGLLGEGLDWLICDEFAQLKPTVWQSYLSQRLIDRKGWALLISTPRGKGLFYDLFRRGQGCDPDYQSWNHPSWANPHLDRTVIEKERERLPEAVFRQEFGGEFMEGAGQVLRYVREAATGEFQEPVPGASYYAGLDLAKINDFTVLTVMDEQRRVVHVDRFNKLDWGLQIQRIRAATERYNDAWTLVDSTGAGEPVYEALCAAGVRVEGYPFTSRSKNDLVTNLALAFEKRLITLPRFELCSTLIDELEAFEYSVTDSGGVKTGAPGGMHDDHVISLGLAAWAVENAPDGNVYEIDMRTGRITRAGEG